MAINFIETLNIYEVAKNYLSQVLERSGDFDVIYESYYLLSDDENEREIRAKLKQFYEEVGFLDIKIEKINPEIQADEKTLQITFRGPMMDESLLTETEEKFQKVIDDVYQDIEIGPRVFGESKHTKKS